MGQQHVDEKKCVLLNLAEFTCCNTLCTHNTHCINTKINVNVNVNVNVSLNVYI